MSNLTKRGTTFAFDATVGGRRLRFSLGTRLPQAARTLARQIECAVAGGPRAEEWDFLRTVLPPKSFAILSSGRGLTAQPNMAEFETLFQEKLDRRVKLGELAESSRNLYLWAADRFFSRMAELRVRKMDAVTPTLAEEYLIFRKDATLARGGSGRGLVTETTVLQAVFNLAVEEGLIKSSPLRNKYKPDSDPKGPDPFTPEEISKLDAAATGLTRLVFLLFRFTGLRGGDVAALTWGAVDFNNKFIRWQTGKRKKWVTIPLVPELYDRLSAETGYLPEDQIIPDATRAKLYKTMRLLGEKAGVQNCHPHRCRHFLAAELLGKGATLFDVATLLGDTVAVCEKFYAASTDKQQERIRGIMEKSG